MKIRTYHPSDRQQIVSLWNKVFPNPVGHNDPELAIDRKLATDDQLFYVAENEGVVLGTIMVGYDGHRGWLYSLAVEPNQQRQGIGTQLVKHAETELKKIGCPKLNLQVRDDNVEVVAFYQSLGYLSEPRISMGKILGE